MIGKSSSDEPSMIFYVGTSEALAGMSVSETPTERVGVHQSCQTSKSSEREKSDILTERTSEKPKTPEPINLDDFVTKEKF